MPSLLSPFHSPWGGSHGSATHIQVALPTSSNSVQLGPEVCLLGESRSFKVTVDMTHRRAPSADHPCCCSRGRRFPSQGADWSADKSYAVLCCGLASRIATVLCYFPRNWWSFISRILSKIASSRWIPPCSSLTRSLRGEPSANRQVGGCPRLEDCTAPSQGSRAGLLPLLVLVTIFQMLIYVTLCDVGGFSFYLLKDSFLCVSCMLQSRCWVHARPWEEE